MRRIVDGYFEESALRKISKAQFAERMKIPVNTLKEWLTRQVLFLKIELKVWFARLAVIRLKLYLQTFRTAGVVEKDANCKVSSDGT